MDKNSLIPRSLEMGQYLSLEDKEKPEKQPLRKAPTNGQYTNRSPCSETSLEEIPKRQPRLLVNAENQLTQDNSVEDDQQTVGGDEPIGVQESCGKDDRVIVGLWDTSFMDGVTSASDANSARPLFRTGHNHFSSPWNGMSRDAFNASNRHFPPNDFATSDHSLTGELHFSRRWDSRCDQNFRGSRLSPPINVAIFPNSRFAVGSTTSDFASGASWPSIAAASNITSTEEVNNIRGQLRDSKAEGKPFKAKPKRRPKQLEDEEIRGGKFPKLSNETTDDENGQYTGSLTSKGTTLNETPVPEGADHKGPKGKHRGVQESCGKDDGAAESLGASPPNCRFVYGPDFAAGIHPRYSMYGAERHVLSDGNSALMDNQRSHDHNLNLTTNSTQFRCREQVEESLAANCMVFGSRDLPLPFTVSTFAVSCTMGVSNSTSQSSLAVASNFTSTGTSTYANSVFSPTLSGDGNEETSLSPVCSEDNSTSSNRDYGRNTVEASAFLSHFFESWEEMMKNVKRMDQITKEWRESEEEGESGKDEKVERLRCEHYQRRCRVRFPCCTQFYPCYRCHNRSTNCKNDDVKACHATHLKCSLCKFEQGIDENSDVCSRCGVKMAEYFCFNCKSFRGAHKNPYHCDLCGICRIHEDEMYHCEGCNVCVKKKLRNAHKCLPNSDHVVQCRICLEDVFTGKGCHIWRCGHKVHRKCAVDYILRGLTTCPFCRQPLRLFNR